MTNRVTSLTFTRNALHYSKLQNKRLFTAQRQITSGVRFELPSEAPIAYRQVRSLETRFTELQADKQVITRTTSTLNASVAQIQSLSDLVTQAKTRIQQGIQALDADERNGLALEIDAFLAQAKQIGNASFNDHFLFGGTRSDDPPYAFAEPTHDLGPLDVTYSGTHQRGQIHIGNTISIDAFYEGHEIFGGAGRDSTVLVGFSGAKHGGGTDTLIGRATLQVRHVATSFSAGSGVAVGTDSAAKDTIIGPAGSHQLEIIDTAGDGSAGTISLNGGPEVAFTDLDTNLRVDGFPGQTIYLDTTSITAGFSGTVDINSTGTLSVDDGNTAIPIDFSTDQVIRDSDSGRFVTIDSSNVRATGNDYLEFPGTSDLFQLLHATAEDLRNERALSPSEYSKSLDRRLDELDRISEKVFSAMGEQSTSLQTMQTMQYRVDDMMLSIETSASEIQGTNFADAVLQMENSQNLLQYTYAVTAQLNSVTLLNFLS